MEIKQYMQQVGEQARIASRAIARAETTQKNRALEITADLLQRSMDLLLTENQKDLDAGELVLEKGTHSLELRVAKKPGVEMPEIKALIFERL